MHQGQEIKLLLRGIQTRLSSLGGSSLKSKGKTDNSSKRERQKGNRGRKWIETQNTEKTVEATV